jgi:hypothetical protein
MNLAYAHKLLVAANEQRHGFIKLRGVAADREVRLMAAAGLVDATFNDGREGSFTSINRLTAHGESFLRAFKDKPIPEMDADGEAVAILNFDSHLPPFRAAA